MILDQVESALHCGHVCSIGVESKYVVFGNLQTFVEKTKDMRSNSMFTFPLCDERSESRKRLGGLRIVAVVMMEEACLVEKYVCF